MKNVSIKLPGALNERLRYRARRSGQSLGTVVREAVSAYLSDDRADAPDTVGAAAADLAGRVAGAKDLSTGDRHLDDYGR